MATAWHLALCIENLDLVGKGRASCSLPSFEMVRRLSDHAFYLLFTPAKWGALALRVEKVGERAFMIGLQHSNLMIIHADKLQNQFMVIPTRVCSPAQLRVHHPELPSCICFLQSGPEIEVLKHMFSNRVTVSNDDLLYIASELKLPHKKSMNKKQLVEVISTFLSAGLSTEEQTAFVDEALRLAGDDHGVDEGGNSKVDHLVDDDVEELFELLGEDNKEDFKEFKDAIATRKLRNKIARARSIIIKAKAKAKSRAAPRATVFVQPVVPAVETLPMPRFGLPGPAPVPEPPALPPPRPVVEPPPLPPPVPPAVMPPAPDPSAPPLPLPADPSLPQPADDPRNHGSSVYWGAFVIGERFPTEGKPYGTVWARCHFHDSEPSRSGNGTLQCTKEWAVGPDDDVDVLKRKLKYWCCRGKPREENPSRSAHMGIARFSKQMWDGDNPPTEAELLELRRPWDIAAVALSLPV